MSSIAGDEPKPDHSSEETEAMVRLGITCVPVDYFHFGEFRYTNLKDAIAAANRRRHPR